MWEKMQGEGQQGDYHIKSWEALQSWVSGGCFFFKYAMEH